MGLPIITIITFFPMLLPVWETRPLEDVHIDEVELTAYDHLLDGEDEVVRC